MQILCSLTGESKEVEPCNDGSPKLPRGWKEIGAEVYSPKAWAKLYAPRTLRLPVASVLLEGDNDPKAGWKALRESLRQSQRDATAFANFAFLEFAKADNGPLEQTPKGARLPKIDREARNALLREIYGAGRLRWPDLGSQSLAAVRNSVASDYNDARWELRVTGEQHRTSYRGLPVPLPAETVRLTFEEGNGWAWLRIRLGGQVLRLRLSASHRYKRANQGLKRVLTDGVLGQIKLYEVPRGGRHANGGQSREGGAESNKSGTDIMAAVVVHLPIERRQLDPEKCIWVKTQKDRLWSVLAEGQEHLWNLNEDHVKARLFYFSDRQQRLREDLKADRRRNKRDKAGIAGVREHVSRRRQNWLNDWVEKATRTLVGFALRLGAGVVRYDDSEQSYLPLPWFKLRLRAEQKCREFGIKFEHVNGSAESTEA